MKRPWLAGLTGEQVTKKKKLYRPGASSALKHMQGVALENRYVLC
jgi:hypothetical protein